MRRVFDLLVAAAAVAAVAVSGVLFAVPAAAAPKATVVLGPDDDVAQVTWPSYGLVRELPLNIRLANAVKTRLEANCSTEVILTRDDSSVGTVPLSQRRAVADAAGPDLMVTLAFNSLMGFPWGVESDGGPRAWAPAAYSGLGQRLLSNVSAFTGRPATLGVNTAANSPWYPAFAGTSYPYAHLEALFIDHNYDHEVILDPAGQGFGYIADGVTAAIQDELVARGISCSAYPSRPSAAELKRLRNLGYQNYLQFGADPVSMSTGNFVTSEALFSLTGVGDQVMDFGLTYNAQSGLDSPVGYGWVWPYGAYAQLFDDDSAGVVLEDGRTFLFEPDGSGGFVSPGDAFASLVWDGAGTSLVWKSAVGEVMVFTVDEDTGRACLASVVDREGKGLSLSYSGAGVLFPRLVSVTDHAGQTVAVSTNQDGRIVSLTRPDGAVWRLGYSAEGDLTAVTKPSGGVLGYSYDGDHRMTAQRGADGVTWLRNEYDTASRVVRQVTAAGHERTLVFDDSAGTTTYTDATGAVTVYYWNSDLQVTKVVDALGGETVAGYLGNSLTGSEQAPGGAETTYEYNAAGQVVTVTDPAGEVSHSVYNTDGNLVESVDELGQTTRYQVDSAGRPIEVTYPDGSTTSTVYDANGDTVKTVDETGAQTTMVYDARGNMLSQTDPLGHTTSFVYDLANRTLSVTDPLGAVTSYEYDPDDNVTAVRFADGSAETCVYDVNGKAVSLTGRRGEVWTFAYDADLYLVTKTAPDGGVTRYDYDAEHRVIRLVSPDGSAVSYTLDALGREVARTDGRGEVSRTAYDQAGRVASETDEAGYVTSYSYDARGLISLTELPDGGVESTVYDQAGRVTSETDPLGGVTSFVYNWRGDVVRSTDQLDRTTVYVYDPAGRLVSQTDPAGAVTVYGYDTVGRTASVTDSLGRVTEFTYDFAGRLTEVTDPAGLRQAAYGYDGVGNLISSYEAGAGTTVFEVDGGGLVTKATDALGREASWVYDSMGRVTGQVDPSGATTSQAWGLAGNVTSARDAAGVVTEYNYDLAGNLVAVVGNATGGAQSASSDVRTAYAYDPRGLLTSITNPLGGVTSYEYGPNGQVSKETDAAGNATGYSYDLAGNLVSRERGGVVTSYRYDAAGQLVERSYSDGSAAESFAYDLVGRQTSASNENGTVSTVYDLAGQVTAETGANGKTTTYTYDSRGLRTSITLPDGAVTSYVWDAERRNTEIATSLGNVVFTYDAVGRELTQVRPNGNTVRTSWTPGDQIDRLTTTRMSGKKEKTVSDFDYSYDIVGNVTGLDRVVDSEENTIAYTYDALGRLTGSTSSDKHEENNLYTYDAAGNRVKWIHGTNLSKPTEYATQTNTYDLAGELVASVEEFMYTSTIKKIRSTENTWQAGNLARSVTTAEWATVTKGVTGKTRSQWVEDRRFAYDAEGRLESASQWGVKTTKGVSQDVQCGKSTSGLYGCPLSVNLLKDPPNHGVTLAPARNTLTRQYDALGRLLMENNGGLETNTWTYGGLDPVYAENWTALTKKTAVTELFRDASGNLLGQNMFATKLDGDWFITDALGSVYGAVSKSGSSVHDESSYNDWGVQLEETDLLVAYSGELRDLTQNGLVSFHARTYQPVYALWLQPDPFKGLLEVPGSTCAYTYVLLNPLTMDEFHGYWGWKSVLGAVAGAVVGAVAVVALAAVCVGTVGVGVLWRQRSARLSARR